MNFSHKPQWWSWADIVRHANRFGIPNFQRGAVWDTSNCVALLESIYEESPCGSFVLWTPDTDGYDPYRHGVPLHGFVHGKSPLWLVDGQQRTRALLDTFLQLLKGPSHMDNWSMVRGSDVAALRAMCTAKESPDTSENAEDDLCHWTVVLPAMPVFEREQEAYFGHHSQSRNVLRSSMFRQLPPLAKIRINSKGKVCNVPSRLVGLIPLATLLSPVGIFNDLDLREAAIKSLHTFDSESVDISQLDDLIPWGPQFVTGYAYKKPGSCHAPAIPMRWSDINTHRQDTGVREMVQRLKGLFAPEWATVFERFKNMLSGNRFAIGWLPHSEVSNAIDAYVRINRAGIRVRSEERALALMSRARPELLDDLTDFIRKRDKAISDKDRKSLLVHESDRQIGFIVWMTTVTRYTTLALLGDEARRWLAVSAIDKKTFTYRLNRVGVKETITGKKHWARQDYSNPGDVVRECVERATPALLLIDSVLSEELCLDHRMARPPARSLYPLIDLFYRIPCAELGRLRQNKDFRAAIARLLHWTLLSPYIDQPDLEQLIVDLHDIDEIMANKESAPVKPWKVDRLELKKRLRDALVRYQASLLNIWHRKQEANAEISDNESACINGSSMSSALTRLALDTFASEVCNACSLKHPAVGWLYAIEHRGNAQEFSWSAQVAEYSASNGTRGVRKLPKEGPRTELKLQQGQEFAYPEKQHIIPFTIAKQIADKGGTRATSSPSNAIGNLTWLSRRQNGLNALSDRWTVMDRKSDADNLAARGMFASVEINDEKHMVIDIYEKLSTCVLVDAESLQAHREETLHLFTAFCKGRTDWIIDQMRFWMEEPLSAEAEWWLGG